MIIYIIYGTKIRIIFQHISFWIFPIYIRIHIIKGHRTSITSKVVMKQVGLNIVHSFKIRVIKSHIMLSLGSIIRGIPIYRVYSIGDSIDK